MIPVELLNRNDHVIASASVEVKGDYHMGSVNLDHMPEPLRTLFVDFESLVVNQVLSLVSLTELIISEQQIRARFDDGRVTLLDDLQIYPTEGLISFLLAGAPV